jgi:hypothetical protein
MVNDFEYDVFICHSSLDKKPARELAEKLKKDGLRVWLDEWVIQPGDSIPLAIEQGLESSRTLVLFMSAHAFLSEWVTLERQAALFRDPTNQKRRFIPILLDDSPIKESLKQFAYIDWREKSDEQYAKLFHLCKSVPSPSLSKSKDLNGLVPLAIEKDDIQLAISNTLQLLADDRFDARDAELKKGGWSKSYGSSFLPLIFQNKNPETVSSSDSITVSHWVIRGLHALRELERSTRCLDTSDSILLTDLLNDAKTYLDGHYRDGKAGLFKVLSQGDVKFIPDVRHSATMAKGLLQYSEADRRWVKSLLGFVIECAGDPQRYDHRIPTHAEILAAIRLLESVPHLCGSETTPEMLSKIRTSHEEQLLALYTPISNSSAGLFIDTKAGSYMAPYYTWWTLDCYGIDLKESSNADTRSVYSATITGLLSFKIQTGSNECAFPLSTNELPDAGATAQIAEVLARQGFEFHSDVILSSLQFIVRTLRSTNKENVFCPYMLWSFLSLLKICNDQGVISF